MISARPELMALFCLITSVIHWAEHGFSQSVSLVARIDSVDAKQKNAADKVDQIDVSRP